jgi:hypothetical protein
VLPLGCSDLHLSCLFPCTAWRALVPCTAWRALGFW